MVHSYVSLPEGNSLQANLIHIILTTFARPPGLVSDLFNTQGEQTGEGSTRQVVIKPLPTDGFSFPHVSVSR